jgi:hypothetical protein
MIISWHGHGYLVAIFTFASSLGMELATETITGDDGYYQEKAWPFLIAMTFAGVLSYIVGRSLNGRVVGRTLIDAETGKSVSIPGPVHSFFFIRMEWWGPILSACGIVVAVYRLAKR